MKTILAINAHLKYVEYLLNVFDTESDEMTLGEIREAFEKKFLTRHTLLNQNFGIYRLLPLMLIKEEFKKDKKELSGVVEKIKNIRDSLAHNNFLMNESGYHFNNGKSKVSMTYGEFVKFIYEVENAFYEEKI